MSNRRQFFTAAAAGGVVLASSGASALAVAPPNTLSRRVGGSPTQATFTSLQGQSFTLRNDASPQHLELVAVQPRATQQAMEQFSLVLRGSAAQALQAGTYRVEHPQSGRFDMHMAPAGSDALGALYRAEFSLLI